MKILHRMGGAILTIHKEWRYSFGKISYKEEDVEAWDQSWESSEKVVRHLFQVWMCRPLANVRFVATANGGVSYTVRPRSSCGLRLILWAFIISCLKLCRNCLLCMFKWFSERIKRCTCPTRDCFFGCFITCMGNYQGVLNGSEN